jgi:DNA polymerase III subunit alpha
VSLLMTLDQETEVEVTLPGRYAIAPGVREQIARTSGVEQVEEV